jgi:hypothetical protein
MDGDLDRIIRHPWREIRKTVTGSPDTPLHANEFGRTANREDIQAVADFFHQQPFARIGSIISVRSMLATDLGPVHRAR